MLTLKLYPSEFAILIGYLKFNTKYQDQVPLQHQLVSKLIMLNYLNKWTPIRIYAWRQKNPKKPTRSDCQWWWRWRFGRKCKMPCSLATNSYS